MNIRKNFEGLFLVAAALGVFASYASAETLVAPAAQTVVAKAAQPSAKVPVVYVVGKRLSAAEKARLG